MNKLPLKLILLFSLFQTNTYGQEKDGISFRLVNQIMLQDTVLNKYKLDMIHDRVFKGVLTKKDSVAYVGKIRNWPLHLFALCYNSGMQKALKSDLRQSGIMSKKLTPEVVRGALKTISYDREWPREGLVDRIDLVYDPEPLSTYHKFSEAVPLGDGRYLLYHVKHIGKFNVEIRFYILGDDENGIFSIDETVEVYYH